MIEQQQRNPEHQLQFQMHVMREPVWRKGIDRAGDKRGADIPVTRRANDKCRETRQRECRKQRKVVDDDGTRAGPEQRRKDDARKKHRIRIRESQLFGIKNVRVEQLPRCVTNRVRDPAETPHAEIRIGVIRNRRGKFAHLGKREKYGKPSECNGGGEGGWSHEVAPPDPRESAASSQATCCCTQGRGTRAAMRAFTRGVRGGSFRRSIILPPVLIRRDGRFSGTLWRTSRASTG